MRSLSWMLALTGALALVLAILARRRRLRERREVGRILRTLADGTLEGFAWHDFLAMPLSEPGLEEIRAHVASLPARYPPSQPGAFCGEAGLALVARYAEQLGGGRSRATH